MLVKAGSERHAPLALFWRVCLKKVNLVPVFTCGDGHCLVHAMRCALIIASSNEFLAQIADFTSL